MRHHHDVARFDEWAATYERHWMQRMFFEPVQELVLGLAAEQVPSPKAILDVGCGTGRLLRAAASRFPGASFDGVDPAAGMVKQADSLVPTGSPIRFQQASAEALPFSDGSFDLVFSTMTFHHWTEQKTGAAEVRRVLAPGGRWLLADFVPSGLMAALSRALRQKGFLLRSRVDATLAESGLQAVADRPVRRMAGNIRVLAIGVRSPTGQGSRAGTGA